jgi:hypothetical protein
VTAQEFLRARLARADGVATRRLLRRHETNAMRPNAPIASSGLAALAPVARKVTISLGGFQA